MKRVGRFALAFGALGLLAWAWSMTVDTPRALLAWLFAFTFGVSIALGALMLVLITDVVGATWFLVFRPIATAIAATLPVFAILFIPVLVGARWLYPWGDPETLAPHLRFWFAPVPFVLRSVLYLGTWSALALLVRRTERSAMRRKIGGAGTLIVGVTASWASFDWLMALAPEWSSTVFGVIFCVSAFSAGVSAVVLGAWQEHTRGIDSDAITPAHFHALGRLALVGVALWAYTQFAQLLIIWIAHIPREIPFYVQRTQGVWSAVNWILVLGHFVAPFLALLMRWLKRSSKQLAAICAWLLLMHLIDVAWLVLPFRGAPPRIADVAALAAIVGFAAALGLRAFDSSEPLPVRESSFAAALRYKSP